MESEKVNSKASYRRRHPTPAGQPEHAAAAPLAQLRQASKGCPTQNPPPRGRKTPMNIKHTQRATL